MTTSSTPVPVPAPVPDRIATVPVPGGEVPVQLYLPPSGTGPGLVVVQEIFGVSRYIAQRAADLAALGYVVAVPELYWRIGLVATPEDGESQEILQAGMAAAGELGLGPAIQDTTAVLAWLRTSAQVRGGVGLVGFCFGGGVAFAVAAGAGTARVDADATVGVDALVSYYGSSIPAQVEADPAVGSRVGAASLHHWGEEDAFIPLEVQERVRSAVDRPGVEWHTYPGANHAFDSPAPLFHHEAASALAWQRTTAFLARVLPLA